MVKLKINNIDIEVEDGTTILEAAKQANLKIPTLCYLKDLQAIGACRVCVVEVEGARNLVASCVTPVYEGMKVKTNSKRVRDARKTIVELILSDHDGDCQLCERSMNCELQRLAHELDIKKISYEGAKSTKIIDESTPAITRDTSKCILCRRCITVCGQMQGVGALFAQNRGFDTVVGPAFCEDLSEVACVQCGQCVNVCPVAAISEHDQIGKVFKALDNPRKYVVVQAAPAIRAALGECFGYEAGTLVTGKMISALRALGFDGVFDTEFTADLTIMEEGSELLARLTDIYKNKNEKKYPLFTSCCPAWINFAEYYFPEMLNDVSTCKSPQQMFGVAAKTYYSKKIAVHPSDIFVVSIMPCTAKKYEAERPEMNSSWYRDVDAVLTTRELAQMIENAGIDFVNLPDGEMDQPMGMSSGAADMFAISGGVMEAALRTAYEIVTGRGLPSDNLHIKAIEGMVNGIKEYSVKIEGCLPEYSFLEGITLNLAVVHELGNARTLLNAIKADEKKIDFVEVMACRGGCIGGSWTTKTNYR